MNVKLRRKYIVLLCVICSFFVVCFLFSKENAIYLKNANYKLMNDMYALYPTKKADIIMLGDSHTYGMNWSELYADNGIINRGIRGDILPGFIARLSAITQLKPKTVCIMGGINDLYAHYSVHDIIENYGKLIAELKKEDIDIVIQSTICVCASYHNSEEINNKVAEINTALRLLAKETGCRYCDINSLLIRNNTLLPEYSIDGLHLNAKGYEQWKNALTPFIKSHTPA